MRAVITRVNEASVTIGGQETARIAAFYHRKEMGRFSGLWQL